MMGGKTNTKTDRTFKTFKKKNYLLISQGKLFKLFKSIIMYFKESNLITSPAWLCGKTTPLKEENHKLRHFHSEEIVKKNQGTE